MAATIKIKNSSTASAVPTSSDLVQGELAVNVTDKRIFTENASGTVVELGTNPSILTLPDGSASAPTLTNDGDTNTGIFFPAADTVGITTGGTERARVDSSGNLGLGVTPSALGGTHKGLQIGGTFGNLIYSSNGGSSSFNSYYDGTNYKYINSNYAARFDYNYSTGGAFTWQIAASGTAGNAITFTQAMTLDASGNLLLGTTTQSGSAKFTFQQSADTTVGGIAIVATDGNGANISRLTDGGLTFRNGGAERARIDSSGNLLVGTTTTTGNGAAFQVAGSGGGMMLRIAKAAEGTAHQFAVNSSVVGSIYAGPSSTSYNTSSDYRLKNTVTPMTGALAKVAALKPCTYKWNVDGSDGEGFIAHELQEVVPQCVTGEKDAVDAEGNPVYQGIDTSFLVATLTAAIQELKAEFDAYKASHP